MGPIETKVRAAKSVGEAIVLLAQALDNQPTVDAWSAPLELPPSPPPGTVTGSRQIEVEASTVKVDWDPETLLREGEDGIHPDTAAARRRIQQDRGKALAVVEDDVDEQVSEVLQDGTVTRFPAPSEEAMDLLQQMGPAVLENRPATWNLGDEDALNAWVKGGPLWLSAYDHDYLMTLPLGYREQMWKIVHLYAPKAAVELQRDICRLDAEASKDFALDLVHGAKRGEQPVG